MAMKRKNLPELVPQVFEHEQFGSIRVVMIDGKPWFVAVDVCRALELKNTTVALKSLAEDEKSKFNLGLSGGATNCVNESGLYRLIFASRKPEAEKFRRWVFHEVLPSIRETGSYSVPKQQVIRIEGEKHFREFKAQYPEGAVEVKRVLFDLEEYDNGEYDVIKIHEVVLHSDKLIDGELGRKLCGSSIV